MKERIIRGTVTASLGQRMLRALQVLFTGGETRDDLEHIEPYGFTSEPFADGKTDCNRSEAAAQAYSGKKEQNLDEK